MAVPEPVPAELATVADDADPRSVGGPTVLISLLLAPTESGSGHALPFRFHSTNRQTLLIPAVSPPVQICAWSRKHASNK
jgi:hypothetical protein